MCIQHSRYRQGRIQGGGQGDNRPPPKFRIFCSYFQNSFSKACLRERNPSAKQEKISVLINYNVWKVKNLVFKSLDINFESFKLKKQWTGLFYENVYNFFLKTNKNISMKPVTYIINTWANSSSPGLTINC